uniref:Peptidase S1 domain-containing protein n=1 Tax=Megaselia scalaris TaxID=36166 RepID=T1GJN9_MEGSC
MKAFIAIILLASSVLTKVVPGIPNGRIVNGVNATVKQAPYIVSISSYKTYDHICGGSIIDKEWILTAGHCLPRSGKVQIYAGITNTTNRTNGQQRFSDYAIIH